MRRYIFVAFILMVALSASATTYYVSKSTANGWAIGNNANNCTTTSTGCLTIAGAHGKAASGDTIIVNDGSYAENLIYITKGVTINPLNANAVTITTNTTYVIDISISDGSAFNMGAIIVECGGTANYGIVYQNNATLYSSTLTATKVQNYIRTGIDGTRPTKINFTASGVTVSTSAITGNAQYSAIQFIAPISVGSVTITSSTINQNIASGTQTPLAVYVIGGTGVSAAVTSNTIIGVAGTSANSIISVQNIAGANISSNTITITDATTQAGLTSGVITVRAATSNPVDSSNPVIANNTISHTATGTTSGYLILVGEDGSNPASTGKDKVNNAQVYGNIVNGGATNSAVLHGIVIGNQTGGEVWGNYVDTVYIGTICKGCTGGYFHDNVVTRAKIYLYAKASTTTRFYRNTLVVSSGYSTYAIEADYDSSTNVYTAGVDFRLNRVIMAVAPTDVALVGVGSTASFVNNGYFYKSNTMPFSYNGTSYATLSLWQAAQEPTAVYNNVPNVSQGIVY